MTQKHKEVELYSVDEVLEAVRKITYKPDWTIDWSRPIAGNEEFASKAIVMLCIIPVLDPQTRERIILHVSKEFPLYYPVLLSSLLYNIRCSLIDWEVHEMQEWFKWDGENVEDPHLEGSNIIGHVHYFSFQ